MSLEITLFHIMAFIFESNENRPTNTNDALWLVANLVARLLMRWIMQLVCASVELRDRTGLGKMTHDPDPLHPSCVDLDTIYNMIVIVSVTLHDPSWFNI